MIAHIDADAFFASALQRRNPKLRGKPLLALGMGGGCVIAASYEAKAFGVKTGMRLVEARKLCPHAIAVPSDFDEALSASRQIEIILQDQCPFIERYSVDEWFLDLSSLPKKMLERVEHWASELQQSIHRKVGLTVSIGIGPSKLLAKMASEYKKPAGLTILSEEPATCNVQRAMFLQSLPADAIPGIGRRRILHSHAHGWKTAWDIANADKDAMKRLFGKPGLEMQRELLGEVVDTVETQAAPPKSISRCRSFRATADRSVIFSHLLDHLTYTMLKMRRHHLACTAVAVWLRNGEYRHEGCDTKIPQPAGNEEQVLPYIKNCFEKLYKKGKPCTQVGLALLGLRAAGGAQYCLFEDTEKIESSESVQQALDALHERFGRDVITRGSAVWTKKERKKKLHIVNSESHG